MSWITDAADWVGDTIKGVIPKIQVTKMPEIKVGWPTPIYTPSAQAAAVVSTNYIPYILIGAAVFLLFVVRK